jgi:hypothetical protein
MQRENDALQIRWRRENAKQSFREVCFVNLLPFDLKSFFEDYQIFNHCGIC